MQHRSLFTYTKNLPSLDFGIKASDPFPSVVVLPSFPSEVFIVLGEIPRKF